jgi:hypothetical protein
MSRPTSPLTRHAWICLVLLLALALRTYHLTNPPWDYHNWRQTVTLMVARDFARHGFHLLHPQVLWVSHNRPSDPSYFSGEFSIQSVLAAVLYKWFGESDTIARMVTISFSLLGIWFFYDLLDRRAGFMAAWLGAFIYSLLPYHLFFGRVFMPDIPALALAIGSIDWLDRWTDDRKWRTLLAAAALAALAVLQKLTVIFIALPALYLFWLAYGRRLLLRIEFYVFTAISGLPSLAWYTHAVGLGHQSGFYIAQPFLLARYLGLWLKIPFLLQVLKALAVEAFSPLGLVLVTMGLFWPMHNRAAVIFRLWVAGAVALLALIPSVLPENHYYFSLLLPGGAALGGLALADFARYRKLCPILALVLALFTAGAIHSALPLFQADRAPFDLGAWLNRSTSAHDLIAIQGSSPNILYFADRRGWMLDYYDAPLLDRFAQAGATYYADVFPADASEHQAFFRVLDSRYRRLTTGDQRWHVYYLAGAKL